MLTDVLAFLVRNTEGVDDNDEAHDPVLLHL